MRLNRLAIIGVAVALSSCATGPEKIRGENWAGPAELPVERSFTPEKAQQERVSGFALLQCLGHGDGSVSLCRVLLEAPENYEFGEAALKMQANINVKSHSGMRYGPAEGDRLNVPVYFCSRDGAECARFKERARGMIDTANLAMSFAARGQCSGARQFAAGLKLHGFTRLIWSECVERPGSGLKLKPPGSSY